MIIYIHAHFTPQIMLRAFCTVADVDVNLREVCDAYGAILARRLKQRIS